MGTTASAKTDFPGSINLANPAHLAVIRKYKFLLARSAFNSDSAMAEAFGVDRSNMTRWKRGAGLSPDNSDKIEGIETVVALLLEVLSPSTIPKWLRGINAHLDNRRPLDVIMAGRLSEVIAAVENERTGAFA
jgi:uncharacterized protein (DUF2384 family)